MTVGLVGGGGGWECQRRERLRRRRFRPIGVGGLIHIFIFYFIYFCFVSLSYFYLERDVTQWLERSLMVRWVVGSISHGGSVELCLVPAVVCAILSVE